MSLFPEDPKVEFWAEYDEEDGWCVHSTARNKPLRINLASEEEAERIVKALTLTENSVWLF